MQKEFLTNQGLKKLKDEIKSLTDIERPKVIQEIQIAREHGDLKENAEYHAAREKQRLLDQKIAKLNQILANAEIVDPSKLDHSKVNFGCTVTIMDLETEKETTYTIVGSYEADIEKNLISYNSPLAKGILGSSEGDIVDVQVPSGEKEYEIIQIEYK